MFSIFNLDNPIMQFMGKVFDVLTASILWLICCIPVVTIGASTTAMYYVTLKIVRDENTHTVRSFLRAFSSNFKQATIIWLIMLLVLVIVGVNIFFYSFVVDPVETSNLLIFGLCIIFALIWITIFNYIFPLIARFQNTLRQTVSNAFVMAIANIGYTVLMLVLDIGAVLLSIRYFPLAGFAAAIWLNSYFLLKIFDKYIVTGESSKV